MPSSNAKPIEAANTTHAAGSVKIPSAVAVTKHAPPPPVLPKELDPAWERHLPQQVRVRVRPDPILSEAQEAEERVL